MIDNSRISKDNYYLMMAKSAAMRSTCIRRHFGSIIVKNDVIISTGYNGAPRGRINCIDLGYCERDKLNIPKGQRYELCRSLHSELNAIIAGTYQDMKDSTLYLVGVDAATNNIDGSVSPCMMCERAIINAGIAKIVIATESNPDGIIINNKALLVNDLIEDTDRYQ